MSMICVLNTHSKESFFGSKRRTISDRAFGAFIRCIVAVIGCVMVPLCGYAASLPPLLVSQPAGGTNLVGSSFTFKVSASGSGPLSYQWFHGSLPIVNATNDILPLSSLALSAIGNYFVVITESAQSVTSSPAFLSVETSVPQRMLAYQVALAQSPGLISEYRFDFLDGRDAKNLHPGVATGAFSFAPGQTAGADQAVLLGGEGHIQLGAVQDFEFGSATGTVEAWIRADWSSESPVPYNPCILANRKASTSDLTRWSVHLMWPKNQLALWNGTNAVFVTIPDAGSNWHHLVSVFDTGNWRVYWDSILVGTQRLPLGASSGLPTQIGSSSPESTTEGWIGAIDEVAFYSAPLKGEEIAAHYDAFVATQPPQIVFEPNSICLFSETLGRLDVATAGTRVGVQWFYNAKPLKNATNETLLFPRLKDSDGGYYYAVATNPFGSVTSSVVSVTVLTPDLLLHRQIVKQQDGLLSLYTFDDDSAADHLGLHPGGLHGTPRFTSGIGSDLNHAIWLDGSSHVDLGNVGSFGFPTGTGTIEATVRADWPVQPPLAYAPCMLACRNVTSQADPARWSLHMVGPKDRLVVWTGSQAISAFIPFAGTNWHHVAAVFEASTLRIYWDGSLLTSAPLALGAGINVPTQLGSSATSATVEGWFGALDDVAFYSSALSSADVLSHFSALAGPRLQLVNTSAGLELSWPSGATAFALERTTDLSVFNWTPVPGVLSNTLIVPVDAGPSFYRLRK